jgi:hypothetical protein
LYVNSENASPRALFVGCLSPDTRAAPGREIELVIDPCKLHFFDRETGQSLLACQDVCSPRPNL